MPAHQLERHRQVSLRGRLHKHLIISAYVCLSSSILAVAVESDDATAKVKQQRVASKETSDQTSAGKKEPNDAGTTKKSAPRVKAAKKKAERVSSAKKKLEPDAGVDMEPGIVCKAIDGYEDYEPLPGAAQTSDEKLLVYVRPFGFESEKVDAGYQSHLTVDGEVRKRGGKAILRQKRKLLEYKPQAAFPPRFIYMKCSISLKGLAPGDYDLAIVLHDHVAKGPPVSQVVKFKVVPSKNPSREREPAPPSELDTLYLPFLQMGDADDDE
jgi:hypothetical protein